MRRVRDQEQRRRPLYDHLTSITSTRSRSGDEPWDLVMRKGQRLCKMVRKEEAGPAQSRGDEVVTGESSRQVRNKRTTAPSSRAKSPQLVGKVVALLHLPRSKNRAKKANPSRLKVKIE